MNCLQCGKDFELDVFPFGDDVTCPHCQTALETDWDYIDDEEGMAAWATAIKKGA